jgi:hypothetical protein
MHTASRSRLVLDADHLRDLRIGAGLMLAAAVGPLLNHGRGVGLPCPLRALTGVPCPLCGLSTSVTATAHLDLHGALAANPMGLVAVLGAVALLATTPRARQRGLAMPAWLPWLALAAMWAFELHRFKWL